MLLFIILELKYGDINEFYTALIVVISSIVGLFGTTLILSHLKSPREKGVSPIYSIRCAGTQWIIPFSYPFFRLTLYQDFLVVSCWTKDIIEYKNIKQIKKDGRYGRAYEIITTNFDKYGQPYIGPLSDDLVKFINEKIKKSKELPLKNRT